MIKTDKKLHLENNHNLRPPMMKTSCQRPRTLDQTGRDWEEGLRTDRSCTVDRVPPKQPVALRSSISDPSAGTTNSWSLLGNIPEGCSDLLSVGDMELSEKHEDRMFIQEDCSWNQVENT